MVDRLLAVYGDNIGCAYDIGCSFQSTLRHSDKMAQRVTRQSFQMMVGAFHGHAHERSCQVYFHPLYLEGTGCTEGEGCEHVFSSSNNEARLTRHASHFHRHQAIEEHFFFWDEDKYSSLGKDNELPVSCLG